MLENGLGQLLAEEVEQLPRDRRFVDLFAGSCAVSWFVGALSEASVVANDLQLFSAILGRAVLTRTDPFYWESMWVGWRKAALHRAKGGGLRAEFTCPLPDDPYLAYPTITRWRDWCGQQPLPITKSYGGYYFSPLQALLIDALLATRPSSRPDVDVAIASLISAASRCAAAPGHTAQPFKPTESAFRFLREAWSRDVLTYVPQALAHIAGRHARTIGATATQDAQSVAEKLDEGDLAFIDPPYSDVHYSRFYHVLETIARGECGEVRGEGRYPSVAERPRSRFSLVTEARDATEDLLCRLAARGVRTIFTFPAGRSSNGMSGEYVADTAARFFEVEKSVIKGVFSTLGGNVARRGARQDSRELVLILRPR